MSVKDAASQYFFSTLRSLGQVLLAVGVLAFLFALVGGDSASGVRRAIANISQGLLFGGHQTTDAGYTRRPVERYTPRAAPQPQPAPASQTAYPPAQPYDAGAQTGYAPAQAPSPAPQPQRQPMVYAAARRAAPPPCVSPVAITCDAPLSPPPLMRWTAAPQPVRPQPQMQPQTRPQMQRQPRPYAAPVAPPRPSRPAPVIADPAQWRRAFEAGLAAQGFYLPREAQWADYIADYWRVMIERWPYRLESPYFCVDQQGRRVLMSHEHGKPPGCGLSQREPDRTLNLDALPRAAASARPAAAQSAAARPQTGAGSGAGGASQ